MRRMMERMGVAVEPMADVVEVVIRTGAKDIVIRGANVSEVKAKGMRVFQVMGDQIEEVERAKPQFTDEDVLLVAQQAGVPRERAAAALTEENGNLARAILKLTS
jgi:nascent polypeptide-associated complex subunit alpha